MKKRSFISVLSVIFFAAITMIACEKNGKVEDIDLMTAEDDAIADLAYDDVFTEVDRVMNIVDGLGYALSGLKSDDLETCPIISITAPTDNFWPREVVIDYGDGCSHSQRTRKGKIIITVSGPMWEEGSSRRVELEDFYVNDHKVEGTRVVTNEGRWMEGEYEGKLYFSVVLTGGKVYVPDSDIVISKEVNRTRTFMEGEDTRWDTRDDIWYIDGIATGINRKGIPFSREIVNSLWKEIGCRFITKGTVLISAEGRPDVILDYGDGECDQYATVTVGDNEPRTINLRRW
jgi:hypothetical protein